MKAYRLYIKLGLSLLYLGITSVVLAQSQDLNYNVENGRDPFIPLIDEKGELRKEFRKPSAPLIVPKVTLTGITKMGNTLYALIDGELVKEGQVVKDIVIEKIKEDGVIARYGESTFEIKQETRKDKKDAKK